VAFANQFDNFIGEYKTSSQVQIIKNAKWCNRFNFKEIVGLKVEANTQGYEQSHVLYILNPHGWSGLPVMNYDQKGDFMTSPNWARTTGSANLASNEWGSLVGDEKETLTVSIEKTGLDYTFSMVEALNENSVLTASCSYQVKLVKK